MVLGVFMEVVKTKKVRNDVLCGKLSRLSDKIRNRRLKLAGHCIRHWQMM